MGLLHEAVSQNSVQAVQRLIDIGVKINKEDLSYGGTPLHIASYKGYETIARLLILNGAYIHRRNIAGYTALYLATLKNNINIVRLLLGHGANINDIGEKHGTPLHVAVKEGHDDMAEFLLFHGAEIDFKNMDGNSPLYFAMNFPKIMKLLIRHGANVNDRNNEGFTPLHTAVSKGKEDAVKVLLRNGSDIDALRTSTRKFPSHGS